MNHSFSYVDSNFNHGDALFERDLSTNSSAAEGIRSIMKQLLETESNLEQKVTENVLCDSNENQITNPCEIIVKCEPSFVNEIHEETSLTDFQSYLESNKTVATCPTSTELHLSQSSDFVKKNNMYVFPISNEKKIPCNGSEFNECENLPTANSYSKEMILGAMIDPMTDYPLFSYFSEVHPKILPEKNSSDSKSISEIKCNLCLYSTKHKYLLDNHMLLHSGNEIFQCSQCKYNSTKNSNLVKHISVHSTQNFCQCSVCDFQTSSVEILNEHSVIHSNDYLFKCIECPYNTIFSEDFEKHVLVHKKKLFKCDSCSYTCNANFKLKNHVKKHIAREISLKYNSISYSSADKNSSNELHSPSGEKMYQCKLCSYCTYERGNLDKHKKIHLGEKPYVCQLCSYCTSIKGNLTKHIRTHTGERSFLCDLCTYSTYEKSNLTKHRRIHTGDKRFKCDICSYCTSEKGNLTKHKRTHSSKKSYRCKICSFEFSFKNQLMSHLEQHSTKSKP